MNFNLTQVDGNTINLSGNPAVEQHAADGKNFFEIIINQINERLYDQWLPSVNKQATIIDIGTNIGLFSLHVAVPNWKVHSFEPMHNFCEIFNSILEKNTITNVNLNECAVSEKDGEVTFGMCGFNTTMNSIGADYGAGQITVKSVKLSTYMKAAGIEYIDFVKLDAEGAEPQIIDSIDDETLKKIRTFFIEFHGDKGGNRAKYKTYMEAKGYKTTEIHDDTLVCVREDVVMVQSDPKSSEKGEYAIAYSTADIIVNPNLNDRSAKVVILMKALMEAVNYQGLLDVVEKTTMPMDMAISRVVERIALKYIDALTDKVSPIKSIVIRYESGESKSLDL